MAETKPIFATGDTLFRPKRGPQDILDPELYKQEQVLLKTAAHSLCERCCAKFSRQERFPWEKKAIYLRFSQ